MRAAESLHEAYVGQRRVRVLADHLARLAPRDARLLDVGCGDGRVARELCRRRADLHCEGIDVLVRPDAEIPVTGFDGRHIPHTDDAFDAVLLIDVLHHCEDPRAALLEAVRVARSHVLVKDHTLHGPLAGPTLRLMDRVGNERHDVALPYTYWPEEKWRALLDELDLRIEHWTGSLGLYPWPASLLFDRSLHFVTRLAIG